MQYFLVKTDPTEYSIQDFQKDVTTTWNGVRHPTAVRAIKAMQPGDKVLVYHSEGQSAIVGLSQVVPDSSRPDPKDSKSWLIDLSLIKTFEEPFITLRQIKATHKFDDLSLIRQGRLSTMPLPEPFIAWLRTQGLDI